MRYFHTVANLIAVLALTYTDECTGRGRVVKVFPL